MQGRLLGFELSEIYAVFDDGNALCGNAVGGKQVTSQILADGNRKITPVAEMGKKHPCAKMRVRCYDSAETLSRGHAPTSTSADQERRNACVSVQEIKIPTPYGFFQSVAQA